MASIKLNKSIRENITNMMVNRKFDPVREKIEEQKNKLGVELYNMYYPKAVRDKMNALPKGWLQEDDDISFTTPTHGWATFYFPKIGGQDSRKRETRRFLGKDARNSITLSRESKIEAKILGIIEDIKDQEDDYHTERRAAVTSTMALLNSVTTVGRAIEVWPEAEFFIRKAVGAHSPSNAPLPVIMTEKLNAQLGLPPKKVEQK